MHSLRTHPGTPTTRSVRSHPGTPDTDATVPLPANYVAEQATIIRQQISFTQDGCPHSIIANTILMEEIFRLQNRLILLRGKLGKEHKCSWKINIYMIRIRCDVQMVLIRLVQSVSK